MSQPEHKPDRSGLLELLKGLNPADAIAIPEIAKALSADEREELLEYLEQEQQRPTQREQHEPRMRVTMRHVAESIGLGWDNDCPRDHPFLARLDGTLSYGGKRVAVVELEAKNRKQIDGALLDLIAHPEPRKVLVIGRSKAVTSPRLLKKEITEKVLPALQALLRVPVKIGIFTEAELKLNPDVLNQFLKLTDRGIAGPG